MFDIEIDLDCMVNIGLLKRIKLIDSDEYGYKHTTIGLSIITKISNGLELNDSEKNLIKKAGINENNIRNYFTNNKEVEK